MLNLLLTLAEAQIIPRLENPWPESVGVQLPFTVAGIGGLVADVLIPTASEEKRNRWARIGGRLGFFAGLAVLALALVGQVLSRQ